MALAGWCSGSGLAWGWELGVKGYVFTCRSKGMDYSEGPETLESTRFTQGTGYRRISRPWTLMFRRCGVGLGFHRYQASQVILMHVFYRSRLRHLSPLPFMGLLAPGSSALVGRWLVLCYWRQIMPRAPPTDCGTERKHCGLCAAHGGYIATNLPLPGESVSGG